VNQQAQSIPLSPFPCPHSLVQTSLSKGREGVTRNLDKGILVSAALRVTTRVRPRHRRPCHLLFARGCAPDSRPAPASRTIPTPGGAPGQERGPRRTSQPGLRSIGG